MPSRVMRDGFLIRQWLRISRHAPCAICLKHPFFGPFFAGGIIVPFNR